MQAYVSWDKILRIRSISSKSIWGGTNVGMLSSKLNLLLARYKIFSLKKLRAYVSGDKMSSKWIYFERKCVGGRGGQRQTSECDRNSNRKTVVCETVWLSRERVTNFDPMQMSPGSAERIVDPRTERGGPPLTKPRPRARARTHARTHTLNTRVRALHADT